MKWHLHAGPGRWGRSWEQPGPQRTPCLAHKLPVKPDFLICKEIILFLILIFIILNIFRQFFLRTKEKSNLTNLREAMRTPR